MAKPRAESPADSESPSAILPRMRKTWIASALIILTLPGQAQAADEVLIDPDSPSGTEYQIPFVGERESARAKQSRRSASRAREKGETRQQSATGGQAADKSDRKVKRNVGRLFGEGISPSASRRGSLAGSSPALRPDDRGESAPFWTVVVWIGALLTALIVVAGGALFVLPEGARARLLGPVGGFGSRVATRLRLRRRRG